MANENKVEKRINQIKREILEIDKQLELDYSIEMHPVLEYEREQLTKLLNDLENG